MTIPIPSSLRRVLVLDAAMSGLSAVAFIAGAGLIASLTALPHGLVFWAGVVLVPWTALLGWQARRSTISRMALIDIVGVNALWTAVSLGLLATGMIQPNALGIAFVMAQALVVGLLTVLQFAALRGLPVPLRAA